MVTNPSQDQLNEREVFDAVLEEFYPTNNGKGKASSSEDIRNGVQMLSTQNAEANQFQTKEEFILHLLETKQVRRDESSVTRDNKIHLKGNLPIDNRVVSGLDWSDVIVDSATVIDEQINKYNHLPQTRYGVKTNLTTKDLRLFMAKNACDAKKSIDGYMVEGLFRIPNSKELPDLSPVSAKKVLCYYQGKIELNHLPTGREGFFGLSADRIIPQGENSSRIAKAKGFRKETYKAFKAQEPNVLQKWFGLLAAKGTSGNSGIK